MSKSVTRLKCHSIASILLSASKSTLRIYLQMRVCLPVRVIVQSCLWRIDTSVHQLCMHHKSPKGNIYNRK